MRESELSGKLLTWYDANAREMPWRVSPADRAAGLMPDPYRIWLSEVMLQQTTVAAVRDYFRRFTARWPGVADLARAEDGDVMGEWAGLGYYARARNLLKCARAVVGDHGGVFPDTRDVLLTLPGIGPYTAAAIAAIAFDKQAVVVDGNVERVMARMFRVETPLPTAKPELTELASRLTPARRPGDYAQAVMDLGATICTPKSPACGFCPWISACQARREGRQADLPRKMPKKSKPTRYGYIYLVQRNDGAFLLERRPDKGLLGGMLGWPGSDWSDDPEETPPIKADWHDPGGEVRHTFTHFHLRLAMRVSRVANTTIPTNGMFLEPSLFSPGELPTVMRKAYDLARPTLKKN